jgi:HSP20 family molecular chaperone IbpA
MSEINLQRVTGDERTLAVFAEAERTLEQIRARAYELFRGRGYGAGRALDDWLTAERECNWLATELVERDQDFVLSVALPGFEPADVSLTATPRALFIQAKMKSERKDEARKGEAKVHWSEFRTADVCRRVEFGQDIDVGKVTATLKSGLLRVVARKAEKPSKPVAVSAAA